VSISGSQIDVGSSANTLNDAKIVNAAGEDVSAGYKITLKNGTLTVNPAALTVTTGSSTKNFDGTALTNATATITGLVNGETATVTATGTITNPGTATNTYTITWGTAKQSNYTITENLGTLRVIAMYTVQYMDGVAGQVVFPTQTYTVPEGSATPAFAGGIPTRPGYTFQGWVPAVAATVTADVIYAADWQAEEYTVTYVDGVGGAAFATQTTTGLHFDDPTPAFNGTPEREGYTFTGWTPAVRDTVTGNATYTAQWENEQYVVTYQDGANGEAFEAQSYTVALDDPTPAFNGTPEREGYTFEGWDPEVAETVTGNATYTAQWAPVRGAGIETIDEPDVPLAAPGASWALINLIAMLATVATAVGMIITFFKKKEEEEGEEAVKKAAADAEEDEQKKKPSKFLGLIPGIGSVIAFFLTEDLTAPMTIVDKWTLLMVAIAAVGGLTAYLTRNKKPETEEETANV